MRLGGWAAGSRNSVSPSRIAGRDIPVASETAVIPPRPIAMLSAAAVNRRERSSRLSRKAMNRRLIPARSFTSSAYAKTFDIGNVILLQALGSRRPIGHGFGQRLVRLFHGQ